MFVFVITIIGIILLAFFIGWAIKKNNKGKSLGEHK